VFPLYDENPHFLTPLVTWAVIATNVAVWLLVQGLGTDPALTRSVCELGLVPGELLQRIAPGTQVPLGNGVACVTTARAAWYTLVTSMFLHGGWMHLIGNMWFLWIFGNNVEDSMGHARFAVFYLLCGLAAAALQIAFQPDSGVPMVGASGAIGGVMGAYARLYPRAPVHLLIVYFVWVDRTVVPAFLMLGYWFVIQVLGGIPALASEAGGVAFWAHVGGFLAGILLVPVFSKPERLAAHRALIARGARDAR